MTTNDKTITVERDGEQNLKFHGELIAKTSSDQDRQSCYFSGSTGRWTTLSLYKTRKGKYICEQIGHTQWVGERTRYSGCVCDSIDEVLQFFGHGWLAKNLYSNAGIDAAETVE